MNNKAIELFVPGRLCLFGEHSDWAGKYRTMNADILPGVAIVTGIEQGIYASVERSERFEMTSEAPELVDVWRDFSCQMDEGSLKDIARSESFFCYCAGVASYLLEWYRVGGVRITIKSMTLPIKGGMSSSAAICVLVARAFNILYGLNLSTRGEMNLAYMGELRTSSRCGRLDQACAFGVKPVLMNFDGDEIDVKPVKIKEDLQWVFADLGASKDTVKILRDLNRAYPFASTDAERKVQWALGQKNEDIVRRAVDYMASGNKPALGALMDEAQRLFDEAIMPLCPSELTAPKLHSVLNDRMVRTMVFGGKGVGSQGDGSVQFLAKDEECQSKLVEYLESIGLKAYSLTVKHTTPIRKAIIPVAGFGTRLYPATRILKKDFFPVVDSRDGLVKPAILILLEELLGSGIEEVCIVLGGENERRQYADFFENTLPKDHFDKLGKECQEYEQKILSIGKHLTYVYQKQKRGFGHAVYQCKDFTGDEPVLLLLGDTLYHANGNQRCSSQVISAYERYETPIISICEIPLEKVSFYGVVTGRWENSKELSMSMSRICEKPTVAYAEEFLSVHGMDGAPRYYGVFGQYVLTSDVFRQLEEEIKSQSEDKEVELTAALERVRAKYGMTAVKVDGTSFDIGNPSAYRGTVSKY